MASKLQGVSFKFLSDKSEKGVKFSFLTPFKANLKAKFKGNKCQQI